MNSQTTRFAILGIAAMLGCASSVPESLAARPNVNVITREEIQASGGISMLEVIQRLRPGFLRSREPASVANVIRNEQAPPPAIVVYLDRVRYGDVSTLSSIQPSEVIRVEFIRGADTTARLGLDHPAGAIILSTR